MRKNKIIDYSLLVGIHKVDKTRKIIESVKNDTKELNRNTRRMTMSNKDVLKNMRNKSSKNTQMNYKSNKNITDGLNNLTDEANLINYNATIGIGPLDNLDDPNLLLKGYSISTNDVNNTTPEEETSIVKTEKNPFQDVTLYIFNNFVAS